MHFITTELRCLLLWIICQFHTNAEIFTSIADLQKLADLEAPLLAHLTDSGITSNMESFAYPESVSRYTPGTHCYFV